MINKNGIEEIKKILPSGWEEKAKELEALTRSRVIKNAEELLILNLLYQTSGKSLGGTSSILKSCEKLKMSKQAISERVVKSSEWLRWLGENICLTGGIIGSKPEWLKYKRVLTCDGTSESCAGSNKTDYNLHFLMDLFTLETIEVKLTDYREGEKLRQYRQLNKGDINSRRQSVRQAEKHRIRNGVRLRLRVTAKSRSVQCI